MGTALTAKFVELQIRDELQQVETGFMSEAALKNPEPREKNLSRFKWTAVSKLCQWTLYCCEVQESAYVCKHVLYSETSERRY